MIDVLSNKFAAKFSSEIRFFKGWLSGPKSVGTPFPTSGYTGRAMASIIRVQSGLPVLEIGPGTGTITAAILNQGIAPENLYSVEYLEHFIADLRSDFQGVNFIHGDAFDLDTALGKKKDLLFDCVISAIPLLNFPLDQRVRYIEDLLSRVPAGRPVIQVSYGPRSPVPAGAGAFNVRHHDFILRNVPPAQLWVYFCD